MNNKASKSEQGICTIWTDDTRTAVTAVCDNMINMIASANPDLTV